MVKKPPSLDFVPKEIPKKYQTLFMVGSFLISFGMLVYILCSIG